MKILLILLLAFPMSTILAQENDTVLLQNDLTELEKKVDGLTSSITAYNDNQTIMTAATLILITVTIASIFLSYKNTGKTLDIANTQLKHTEKELQMKEDEMVLKTKESQALVKADLRIELLTSNNLPRTSDNKTKHLFQLFFNVKNIGNVQADRIEIHYKIYDQTPKDLKTIIADRKSIIQSELKTEGSILPNNNKPFGINLELSESKLRHVILWIEYGQGEFDEETIYQINVRGGENQFNEYATHSTEDIEFAQDN